MSFMKKNYIHPSMLVCTMEPDTMIAASTITGTSVDGVTAGGTTEEGGVITVDARGRADFDEEMFYACEAESANWTDGLW